MIADLGIVFGRVCFVMLFMLNLGGILTWVERKQSAIMQDRIGANRASIRLPLIGVRLRILGLLHPLADAIKMLTKEDFMPARADRFLFSLAPFVSVFFALTAFASIPFGDTLRVGDRVIPLQAVTLNVGVLYVFAMLSLGVYGVMMAGWSSANNYALLGGQRAAALMISAEIAIGASIMGVVMVYGSLDLQDIVRGQGHPLFPQVFGAWIPAWGIVTQPLAFLLFLTAGIAATKRIPFDMPEGESEIIGYFVEYSGMKFGMFAMADFLETVVIAGMTTALFLGGWQIPYLQADGFHFPWGAVGTLPQALVALLQVGAFVVKVCVMIFLMMLIRWTLPRFRYDQAMRLGWLGLFPLSILNIVLTGIALLLLGGRPS
jgi:NADH-quinone oxidoreductase subunit H